MKARMNPHWLSVSILLLAMVGTAAGEIIFFDDFAGDNTKGRFVMEAENYSSRIIYPGESQADDGIIQGEPAASSPGDGGLFNLQRRPL